MKNLIDFEKAIANKGNLKRLKKLMRRAGNGEKLTIGFIGGSITQGSLASTPETCYAYRVYSWWQENFKTAEFTYLNAGIGGTTSQFGAARVEADLLRYKPDFIIIEFSVNDDNNEHFLETYEGLVRRILSDDHKPAVLIVNNVYYDDGRNAQEQHNTVGRAYQIPCLSIKNCIYPLVEAGIIKNREITPDDLHPNDKGHELIADTITSFLEKVSREPDQEEESEIKQVQEPEIEPQKESGKIIDNVFKKNLEKESEKERIIQQEKPVEELIAPITKNRYQNSVRYQNYSPNFTADGFIADTSKQETITQFFKNGWIAGKEGATITFEIEATGIAVQYRKSVNKPAPIALAIVDGDEEHAAVLDGNFEETWGDCLYLQTITETMELKKHQVEIRIITTHDDDAVPFYLVSVIGSC